MSERYDAARRGLEAASQALSRLRSESGAPERPPEGDAAAAAGLRAALDAARRALEAKAGALETAEARIRELEREREELLTRAKGERPDPGLAEKVQRAEAESMKVKLAAAAETAAMNGRLSLQQAEFVRLNSLRRKAEQTAEQSELTRREVEDALRRDLRTVHAALDRAAAEAGVREARAQSDIQSLTRRLEAALTRTEQLSREQQAERDRWRVERARLASTLQRSSAVNATLRRDLGEMKRTLAPAADVETADLQRRLIDSAAQASGLRAILEARVGELARRLSDADRELSEYRSAEAARALTAGSAVGDPAALVARLRPAAAAAYERLRELSASVPLSDAERASLQRAASAVAGLCDAVALVERYLDSGPAGEVGALGPAVERAAADWEEALKRKGCRLDLRLEKAPVAAVFDPADLRLGLDQIMRRAFETLPTRRRLEVRLRRAGELVELAFEDDGPGLSPREASAAFEPGADAKGLALPLARRLLRRWGGDARFEKSSLGGGRLVLTFRSA